ncbi:MAG TPA: pyridoxal phosphate-dependent aminotransferase [Terriglobia bacterium]|nr:pyridoxal phosphate-dependent aminotransferase [Terriglobia bacterium]
MFSERTNWPIEVNDLTRVLQERRSQGLPITDLTESNPTRSGFKYGGRVLEAFSNPGALEYAPDPHGLMSAREAVVEYYAARGATIAPKQIFLTSSTSEAYSYIFRLLGNPGDEVLVPRPGYPLFDFLTRLNDLEASGYPLVYDRGWRIDLAALERAVSGRTRAILLVHPNNPTGSYVHLDELDFLISCCKRAGTALISDEVFADYAHPAAGASRAPTFAGEKSVLTFTLSGISKLSALPQMKCAWLVVSGPEDLTGDAIERLETIADTYLSLSAPVACALPEFLKLRHVLQPQIHERLRLNLARLDAVLGTGPIRRLSVEAGWYAILQAPGIRSDEEWCVSLLREDGVLVHPGHFYDFAEEGYVVVSLLPPQETFGEGVTKLLARVKRGASKTNAVNRS